MIRVLMDSNEQNSDRATEIQNAVTRYSDDFAWEGYSEIPVDLRFQDLDTRRYISVELKTASDLVSSVLSGHLARQVIMLHDSGEPGFIVCTGSKKEVLGSVQPIKDGKYRGKEQIFKDFGRIEEFCADAYSNGYPVFFWDVNWAKQTLKCVKSFISQPSICKHIPKPKNMLVPVAMLCMIPGVGAATAEELIRRYSCIELLCSVTQETLAETKVNGKKLGKKADVIWRALNDETH